MNSYYITHLLLLLWIPAWAVSATPVTPAWSEADSLALMTLYTQARQKPAETLPLLDSLERTEVYSQGYMDYFRSCAYRALSKYYMAMYYARRVVHYQESRRDTLLMKGAYMLLAESSVASYHLGDAVRYINEGKQYAGLAGDSVLEANMLLMEGEVYRRLGMAEKGYQCLRKAIASLSGSVGGYELYVRSRVMGYFMQYCIEDRKSEEAWRVGLRREEVVGKLEKIPAYVSGMDEQQAYLYSKMAYLAYKLEKYEQAAEYAAKFGQTAKASTVPGKLEINDYLLEKGDYQTVLRHVDDYLTSIDGKDSLNIIYIRTLYQSSRAYRGVGDYKQAYEAMLKLREVTETMRMSIERSELFDLADLTQVVRQEYELQQAAMKLQVRNWVIAGLITVALALIVMLVRIYLYWKTVGEKNRKLASLILELNDKNNTVALCRTEPEEEPEPVAAVGETQPEPASENMPAGEEVTSLSGQAVFLAFDARVREERMYLNYQLSRDDYAALMGVDRNRFAAILKEYTHGNLNAYLNHLRLDYSVGLFRTHPEWSVSEIASRSALPSLSTFYRLFKEKYGMSPHAFRSKLDE